MTLEPRPADDNVDSDEQEHDEVVVLLARAREARTARKLAEAHALYRQAAELGSADACYALGVFSLTGQVVARDVKQAIVSLRQAADAGHLLARVHLANTYDSGVVSGAPDPERAALFLRAAARSLKLGGLDEPADQQALARAGVGRYLSTLDDEDRELSARKARALGYLDGSQASARVDTDTPLSLAAEPALPSAPAAATEEPGPISSVKAEHDIESTVRATPKAKRSDATEAKAAPITKKHAAPAKRAPKPKGAPSSIGAALSAALFGAMFLAAGWGVGFAALHIAEDVLTEPLPIIGTQTLWLWFLGVWVVGVLPQGWFYRAGSVIRALGVALVFGFAGFFLHGTGALAVLDPRPVQGLLAATAGLWLALLVLGFTGGAKASQR